ncbi:MAG TPA: hypothetical protein VMV41_12360 [Cellulomonadaceae bacterium]|nr:hypothetical protein [Cellulomonadaceae bacterium]
MTGQAPASVPAHAPRFFDTFHLPTANNAAVQRASARDAAYTATDRLTKALAALRGSEQDLDLNLEAYRRALVRADIAIADLNRLLAAAPPVPLQTSL